MDSMSLGLISALAGALAMRPRVPGTGARPAPRPAAKAPSVVETVPFPHDSYEPFRDYRPGRAGDPYRTW